MRLLLGFALGFVVAWIWLNRKSLGLVIEHRDQLDALSRLSDDLSDLGVPGFKKDGAP